MPNLTTKENESLERVSAALGVPKKHLYRLINFESRFKPDIKNKLSSARGLIQFINSTARSLGYKDSLDLVQKNPTIQSQLEGPVFKYLNKYKPFPTEQSLYMAVFYPKARYWYQYKQFPKNVQKVNPGIKTPADYVNKVKGIKRSGIAGTLLLVTGLLLLIFTKERK